LQVGHLPLALAIASYDWNPRTIAFCIAMHWLPNGDSLIEKAKLAKPGFHCTVTHSIAFALAVSALIYPFSAKYAALALAAILAHYAADIGSSVGLPLLWPVSRKKYTLNLFKDTGYWGWQMLRGYYAQPMAWILEGGVTAFLAYRLWAIYH
jgi:membrane-bound metal-dependent hydrolase YbcI (DUF457 family)